jgi:adenylosuccinate synthase
MSETLYFPKPSWLKTSNFASTCIIGGQWGDEAKGKIVYTFAKYHHVVLRYNGGHNAGHTLDNVTLHIIPSGIQHEHTKNVMCQGMVISPKAFHDEILDLEKAGTCVDGDRLYVSPKAHVILSHEVALDIGGARNMVGTTGRGIGPTYEQMMARTGIRVADLDARRTLSKKLKKSVDSVNARLPEDGQVSLYDVENEVEQYGGFLTDYMADTKAVLKEAFHKRRKVLFEGAQGALLDVNNGTWPNVTSSNTTRPSVGQVGYYLPVTKALGVFKAPMSRVGKGPFPAEWGGTDGTNETRHLIDEEKPLIAIKAKVSKGEASDDEKRQLEIGKKNLMERLLAKILDKGATDLEKSSYFCWKGDEFGASTGRPRRLGPLDLVIAKHVADINALDGLIFTKWDVYSGTGPVPFVIGYTYAEKEFWPDELDADEEGRTLRTEELNEFEYLALDIMKPVIEERPGWKEDIRGMTDWEQLPKETNAAIAFAESFIGVPCLYFSTGPKKDEMIVRKRN